MRRRRNVWDVVVIGGGVAGLTAAWHAAERGLATALLEPGAYGGQVVTVNALWGWPSATDTSGYALATSLTEQARRKGVELIPQPATAIELSNGVPAVRTPGGAQRARRVIAATGGSPRGLGLADEDAWRGKGISHCADCDGPLLAGTDAVVIGGGDSALQEASILAGFCRTVHVVVRSRLRAKRAYIEKARGATNIAFVWDSVVDDIRGDAGVTGVLVRNLESGAVTEIACAGVFPFTGITPNIDYLPAAVKLDSHGFVSVDSQLRTSVPAISAIGAVRAQFPGQLVNAAADGAAAAGAISDELMSASGTG